ncbi:MAG: hypothetical protein JSR27_02540 [Proteobacteria bacterium]|nr:hypothetical protein [Pseudomonadota bacterium]
MRFGSVLIGCLLALSTSIQAQEPAPDAQIPSALRDWRAWVMHDLDYRACPFLATHAPNAAGDFVCAWPGTLHLDANAGGATFSIAWRTQAPSWIFLPGDAQYWPQQVTVNGQAQPVLEHGGAPALWLAPGSYAIRGTMAWRERPQALAVPPSIGLIALSVDGKPVAQVQRDGGELTLGRAAAAAPQADHIEVRVFRRLADGVPALLTTQIRLAVSGQARAESLGPVLPEGFAPMSIEGDWPARLDGDGKLSVQVQPGNATLTVQARALAPLTAATARLAPAPWPKQEIWSYAADPHLRVTAASGAVQVDPRQSDVPDDWLSLPAFALGDGAKLSIEQRSRGIAPDAANRLTLQREAWLDFSGGGWYARDHINGNMVNGWRLDAAAPYTLEQATAQNAKAEDLLITRGANPGSSGVEWRTPNVDLSANLRIAAAAAMPVAGWQQTFDSVSARLHLPFGYKLLAAPGADSAAGSWIAGWTLLDVFVCAVLVLLAWRLLGLPGAAAAVAYLVLGYQESDAPLWSLIAVIALALIAKALPDGKLAHAALRLRALALLILVLIALPFVATQVRDALYPQLETGGYVVAPQQTPMSIPAPSPPPPPMATRGKNLAVPAPMVRAAPQAAASEALESIVVSGTKISRMDVTDHYSQTTVVQTGAGMPDWSLGSEAELSWSGPVLANQSVRLLIAPPWLVRPLRIVLVALLAFLVMRLFRGAAPGFRLPRRTALGASLLVLGTLALAPSAQAQGYPPQELLQQLRARLLQAPKCAPACASVAQAQVSADGDAIGVVLEAHAGERIALPLPNTGDSATLKSVQVDGVATDAIARGADNSRWLELARGVHRVQLAYVAAGDKATLAFPLKPARVLFSGKGWNASGIADDRLLADSLTLARVRADAAAGAKPTFGVQQFPPYVEVTRFINLGLDWTATTHVRRLAPQTGGFTVAVPLIKGEHVSSAGIEVKDGVVEAAIADGAAQTSWNGTLDKGGSLTLTAPALTDHAEIWRVVVSPTWHVEFSGVPGVDMPANEDANDYRNFEFHPLPGETLTLTVTRPQALQGAQRAIDAANLGSDVGQHAATHTLQLTVRTSQGGDQVIAVPADAQVLGVTRDGAPLNLRAQGGKLTLPLTPGTHRFDIRFRTDAALGLATSTPPVALGLPAANVNLALNLPANRWLLAVWGPTVGPAVLYWGELIVMILVAFALSRSGRTRLKFRDWLLLGLGFSTFSWGALVLVVAWLFAFDWRGREAQPKTESLFNLSQTGLVVLTLFALASVVSAIPQGLLGSPDMHVAGNGSTAQALQWFADRSMDALPQATAITVPLWVYKVLMLAWALWLANALIGWLRDAFAAWTKDGYWRKPALAASPLETTPEKPADAS